MLTAWTAQSDYTSDSSALLLIGGSDGHHHGSSRFLLHYLFSLHSVQQLCNADMEEEEEEDEEAPTNSVRSTHQLFLPVCRALLSR